MLKLFGKAFNVDFQFTGNLLLMDSILFRVLKNVNSFKLLVFLSAPSLDSSASTFAFRMLDFIDDDAQGCGRKMLRKSAFYSAFQELLDVLSVLPSTLNLLSTSDFHLSSIQL